MFDFNQKKSDNIIGYAAHFSLLNGFEKTLFMTADDLKKHGAKFSQTFKKGYGLWKDDFDSMAQKTVIKLLLSKFAPLSVDMQRAVITDQAIVNDADTEDVTYVDNDIEVLTSQEVSDIKETARITEFIENAKTKKQLNELQGVRLTPEQQDLFNSKIQEVK